MKTVAALDITMGLGFMLQSQNPSQSPGTQIACWIVGNAILFIGVRVALGFIENKKP